MIAIQDQWCTQIDVTNYCFHECLYCSRMNKHLRKDQRAHMSLEQFVEVLDALQGWTKMIGIIGGEPLMHPQFREICQEIKKRFPKSQMGLWTSGPSQYKKNLDIINETFGFIAYNEHNEDQKNVCRHQPLTIAIKDAVKDPEVREKLINDCWVQREWCATSTHKGAYFCEVAAAQDILLNDGANAWKIEKDWWKRTSKEFESQKHLCQNCGMAIPMERELIKVQTEKMSPSIVQLYKEKNVAKMEDDIDYILFDKEITLEELKENIKYWTPGNYREDLKGDEVAPEGRGYRGEL